MNDEIKVLLIEDNSADVFLLEVALATVKDVLFTVESASRLSTGLKRLEAGGIDAVLLDLQLPDSAGFDTFIRAHEQAPQVPIIVLSGVGNETLAIRAVREGAQDYLVKGEADGRLVSRAIHYAIQRKRVERELQRRHDELLTLHAISAAVNQSLDLKQTLRNTLDEILRLDLFERKATGAIFLLNEQDDTLLPITHQGFPPSHACLAKPPRVGECLCGLAAQSGEIIIAASDDARHCRDCAEISEHQEICLPLKARDRSLGIVVIELSIDQRVSDADIRLLTAIGNQVSVAIDNARLYEETQRSNRELLALDRMEKAITSTLDLDAVLDIIIGEIKAMLNAQATSILLHDSGTDELIFVAATGSGTETLIGLRMPATQGIAGWTMKHGQSVLVHDAQNDPRFYKQVDTHTGFSTHSLLATPLKYKERVIGVIEVVNHIDRKFDEHSLQLLDTLAGSAAIAIENARMYQETMRRLAEVQISQEVMLAAASTLNFDEVLTRALQAIYRSLGIEYLSFASPDETGEYLVIHPSCVGFEGGARLPLDGSVSGRAYKTGQPQLIGDTSKIPYYFEATPDLHSELAVPVRTGERTIGVLNAESLQMGAFDEDSQYLFEAIAAQLGVVMENARLYEMEREQRKLIEQSQVQLVQSEKLAAMGRLAASLAHEINNPLQTIHNGLRVMLSFSMSPDEQQEYLVMIDEEVNRLRDLVTRTLDFARRPTQAMKPTDLNMLLQKVLALVSKYLQHHNITLQCDLAPDLPSVLTTSNEISQVFLNLLLNAAEAMAEGGSLRISTHVVDDDRIAINFADTGCGIAPEHLDHVFEPFFSTKEKGTGLGLAVSYNIVKRHNGEIIVQSAREEGTTFTVLLPISAHSEKREPSA
jgi:two-component system NtrC family sensor kinase